MARIVRQSDSRLPRAVHDVLRDREDAQARKLVELLGRVEAELEQLRSEQQEATTRLAFALAEKLAGAELEARPSLVARIVEASLARLPRASRVVVRLHPDDVALVPLTQPFHEVLADDSLARGDCIIESNVGRVDARMRTRIESLRSALGISEDV